MQTLISAHDATRRVLCKAVDCDREAVATRGPYALLCDDHAKEARESRTVARGVTPAIDGAELDKALARRRTARVDAAAAFATFKQALEELQQTAREALA